MIYDYDYHYLAMQRGQEGIHKYAIEHQMAKEIRTGLYS